MPVFTTKKIQAVIFDCDGTLVDSESIGIKVLIKFAKEIGLRMDYQEAMLTFSGNKMADILSALEGRLGKELPINFEVDLRSRMEAAFQKELCEMPGAGHTLSKIVLPICVASNAPTRKIRQALTLTCLLPYFGEWIFSAYEVGKWKPDPELFFCAAKNMNISPEDCMVVEDSIPGIEAGLAAGMRVFALQSDNVQLVNSPDVTWIEELSDLLPFLDCCA